MNEMKAIELVAFCREILKNLSKVGVKTSDYEYVEMFNEYRELTAKGCKKELARHRLAKKYGMSESTVYRVVSRLCSDLKS